jgi:mono/diheme cytochrome c family protein
MLERGQERFQIFCVHCHGQAGYGDGMIVHRGFTQPPSYHLDRLRDVPDGHLFDVITNGLGSMPSFDDRIAVQDRWAIVAYVRALQLSQHATLNDLSEAERRQLSIPQGSNDDADNSN